MLLVFLLVLCRNHHFCNDEIIIHTHLAMEQVHHELLEVIGLIRRSFLQMDTKNYLRLRVLFVGYRFRHVEHNNRTLCTHFADLSLVCI